MTIQELHWQFRLLYNKVNTQTEKTFNIAEVDAFLNRAIEEYVEIFYAGNNSKFYKLGFEVTQQRIDMLSTLVISSPIEQPPLKPSKVAGGVYEFKFDNLKYPYKHFLRASAKSRECNRDMINISIEQTDDLNTVLCDKNRQPSLQWKRAVGKVMKDSDSFGKSSLYVYTNNEFSIDEIQLEYLKIPNKVSIGGYPSLETATSANPQILPVTECDLPTNYHNLVVDIAVQEVSRILRDGDGLNLRTDRFNKMGH